eukprot:7696491-Pyramimonas_sp.AAC.1
MLSRCYRVTVDSDKKNSPCPENAPGEQLLGAADDASGRGASRWARARLQPLRLSSSRPQGAEHHRRRPDQLRPLRHR